VVTRTQIDNATPEAVLNMLGSWKTSAADLVTATGRYEISVRKPGGENWSGATAFAATAMASNDGQAIDRVREAIDAMADTASNSINDPVIPNLNDVRAKIASAETAGFTVNDNLTVSYNPATALPDPIRTEDAERRATEIQAAATTWWESDQDVADQINRDKGSLAGLLDIDGTSNYGRYERLLREAGLLTGPSPDGYYAQWLENAAHRAVSPEMIVEIAQRHDITPEGFEILEGMEQIQDPEGKSFFLIPEGTSGDDASKAVLMTYILNAGTDYDNAGETSGVTNDFAETPYSADEVQRTIDRQESNDWSYDDDVAFVDGNGGRFVTTPNGMLMGAGGNWLQDGYSREAGTTWGDIFMVNIDDTDDAAQQLSDIVESGHAWDVDDDDGKAYERALDLDRFLHHEERHSQQWAENGYLSMIWEYAWNHDALEEDAGLSDGGYR
jgi:hypothetical protein